MRPNAEHPVWKPMVHGSDTKLESLQRNGVPQTDVFTLKVKVAACSYVVPCTNWPFWGKGLGLLSNLAIVGS